MTVLSVCGFFKEILDEYRRRKGNSLNLYLFSNVETLLKDQNAESHQVTSNQTLSQRVM